MWLRLRLRLRLTLVLGAQWWWMPLLLGRTFGSRDLRDRIFLFFRGPKPPTE